MKRKDRNRRLKRKLKCAGNTYCPLCLKPFGTRPHDATLEHVPPSSCDGDVVCLVCRKCNNITGRRLESRLHRAKDGFKHRLGLVQKDGKEHVADARVNSASSEGIKMELLFDYPVRFGEEVNEIWISAGPVMTDRHRRATAKIVYLAIGSATNGLVWKESWSQDVRDYIMGDSPSGKRFVSQVRLPPSFGSDFKAVGFCRQGAWYGWACMWNQYNYLISPLPWVARPDGLLEVGRNGRVELDACLVEGFPQFGSGDLLRRMAQRGLESG